LLDGFKGYLQTDGYAGYNAACKKYQLTPVGCMDHARRKFMKRKRRSRKVKKPKLAMPIPHSGILISFIILNVR
jgi:hypothetical protein